MTNEIWQNVVRPVFLKDCLHLPPLTMEIVGFSLFIFHAFLLSVITVVHSINNCIFDVLIVSNFPIC